MKENNNVDDELEQEEELDIDCELTNDKFANMKKMIWTYGIVSFILLLVMICIRFFDKEYGEKICDLFKYL